MSGSARAAEPPSKAPGTPTITASAAREATRLARSTPPALRAAQPTEPRTQRTGWIGKHPRLFGALVGFGVGCAVGASQVGGSTDTFYNSLDEFACPVVGGIGAAAGVIVGSLFK